jgi:hypothetical protein
MQHPQASFAITLPHPSLCSFSLPTTITQKSFGSSSQSSGADTPTGGELHIYVISSVKHPGVYTLPAGERIFQLIEAARGKPGIFNFATQ